MYSVEPVVCDWGIFENGELKLILNSYRLALKVLDILILDEKIHLDLNTLPPLLGI